MYSIRWIPEDWYNASDVMKRVSDWRRTVWFQKCVDQVFALKMFEKGLGKDKDLYVEFMGLEEVYVRVERDTLRNML